MNTRRGIVLDHARLIFRNFSGAPGRYNPQGGDRNFCVLIDTPALLEQLVNDGYNVKYLRPKNPDDVPAPFLKVKVSFKVAPPKIVLVTSNGKTVLSEGDLNILDFSEYRNVDLIITPYYYDFAGSQGVSAYLKSMYFTMYEDELEQRYMDVPDSAKNSIVPNEPW